MNIISQMIVSAKDDKPAQASIPGTWPNGEPKSVRDAYDAKQSKGGKK